MDRVFFITVLHNQGTNNLPPYERSKHKLKTSLFCIYPITENQTVRNERIMPFKSTTQNIDMKFIKINYKCDCGWINKTSDLM